MNKWVRDSLMISISVLVGIVISLFLFIGNELGMGTFPDWIVAIGTTVIAIFTLVLAFVAWKTAESWKEERKPEVTVELQRAIRNFQCKLGDIYLHSLEDLKNNKSYYKTHKNFVDKVGDFVIELELALGQYLIYKPEIQLELEDYERKIKDTYCTFCYIYEKGNEKRLERFEEIGIRKLNNKNSKNTFFEPPKKCTSLTDEELLKELLDFHTFLLQRHLKNLFRKVSHRNLILGKIK